MYAEIKFVNLLIFIFLFTYIQDRAMRSLFGKISLILQNKEDENIQMSQLTQREKRFIKFASVEYDGQLYMTPQDFLDSVTETDPRRKYIYLSIFLLNVWERLMFKNL